MAFAVRRAGQHRARLSLIVLIVALVVGGLGGMDAVAERMLAAGASRILAEADPAARTVLVGADEASDADAQDAEVRRAITAAFAGTDVVVSRQVAADADLEKTTDDASTLRLLDDDRVPDLAVLTGGTWPQKSGQIALPDAAAARLRLSIGAAVDLADQDQGLTLVGTWTAKDPAGAAWHGDPAVASGETDGAIGPAVVVPGALAGFPDTPRVTWEIAPVDVDPADIPELQRALTDLQGLPDTVDPRREHNLRILGSFGDTLQRQSAAVSATRGLLVAPLLIIALLGALVLGIVLTTLTTARDEELVLLRARGASAARLAASVAVEAALLAAAGASLALAALALSVGVTVTALAATAGAVVLPTVLAGLHTLRRTGGADVARADARRSDAGRPLAALLLPVAIAVGLAALSSWQLFATRTVVRADGTPEPVSAVAPALLLVAACTLAPVAAGPLAALAERMLRRSRGITPILPLRQIARRMGGTAVAILCLALAAASLALAVTAPASADTAEQRTRIALLGGDVRMTSDDGLDVTAVDAATWDGVSRAAEVLRTPLTVGSDTAVLVAGSPKALDFARPIPTGADGRIRAEITRSLADRLDAGTGTVFTARIRFVTHPVSIEVARIVDALPGVGDRWGVAADSEQLRAAGIELAANELWLDSDTPADTARRLRAQATHPVRILTTAQVSAAPVTSIAPAVLTAGAALAALLGVIGFLAAASATARVRRGEALVLRALGLRTSQQRVLRTGETVGVAAYSVTAGAALGAAVALAVLPIVLGVGA